MDSIVNAEEHGMIHASHNFRFSHQLISWIPTQFGSIHTPTEWSEGQ